MIRTHILQRGPTQFWTGHGWASAASAALRMTLGEALSCIEDLGAASPGTLRLIKDYGTTNQCVLCTA